MIDAPPQCFWAGEKISYYQSNIYATCAGRRMGSKLKAEGSRLKVIRRFIHIRRLRRFTQMLTGSRHKAEGSRLKAIRRFSNIRRLRRLHRLG
jgi:hypothetical protein